MSRHIKQGAGRLAPKRPRASGEQAARILCGHDEATPAWARDAIDSRWEDLRSVFATHLLRGESVSALGGLVADVETIPGGLAIAPKGGTVGLSVGRNKLRELAAQWAGEASAAAVDTDPGPRALWVLVQLARRPALMVRVRLRAEGEEVVYVDDFTPREAERVGAILREYVSVPEAPRPDALAPTEVCADHIRTVRAGAGVAALIVRGLLPEPATLADLAKVRRSDLLKLKNFGRASLEELTALLDRAGLAFAPEAYELAGGARHG